MTKDKSIEADPKTRTQLFLSRVVSKPSFGVYDQGVLRIKLKFLLYFLRNRCARTLTPERLKLELLVGWQVNKNNSPVSSTSILRRRQKGCYKLHIAF